MGRGPKWAGVRSGPGSEVGRVCMSVVRWCPGSPKKGRPAGEVGRGCVSVVRWCPGSPGRRGKGARRVARRELRSVEPPSRSVRAEVGPAPKWSRPKWGQRRSGAGVREGAAVVPRFAEEGTPRRRSGAGVREGGAVAPRFAASPVRRFAGGRAHAVWARPRWRRPTAGVGWIGGRWLIDRRSLTRIS